MKVIIVGAGEAGFVAAETISSNHDVMVIERDEATADALRSRLSVAVLRDDGTNPKVLRKAIDSHNADIIISTLYSNSENLFVCMVAKAIKPELKTVASINNPDFMTESEITGFAGVDVIISPELVTAEKMFRLCTLKNAVEYETISSFSVDVAVFHADAESKIIGNVVMQLPQSDERTVFAIIRDGDLYTHPETMEIHPGDDICVFGSATAIAEFNLIVGIDHVARQFCILGGSTIAYNLAKLLLGGNSKHHVKIIERDADRCKFLSKEILDATVINADYLNPEIQYDEDVFKSDATVSTSSKDDTNLLICMSAKRHNAPKVVARFFATEYEDIFKYTDLQTIIGFDRVISNEIIKCTISDDTTILRMSSGGIFFTHTVSSRSKLEDRFVGDLQMPEGLCLVAIVRRGVIAYPKMDTKILDGDVAIVFSVNKRESELIKLLGNTSLPELS